jgi:hypothetical protein
VGIQPHANRVHNVCSPWEDKRRERRRPERIILICGGMRGVLRGRFSDVHSAGRGVPSDVTAREGRISILDQDGYMPVDEYSMSDDDTLSLNRPSEFEFWIFFGWIGDMRVTLTFMWMDDVVDRKRQVKRTQHQENPNVRY